LSYLLFLLVTATLFIRPAEIFSDVYDFPIYECLILACLAVSLPGVLSQLSAKSLADNPITACVLGLLAAVVLSHLARLSILEAWTSGFMFFKLVVYYLLLVANVNSEARLRSFLRWLLVFIALAVVLALLSSYRVIELPGVDFIEQWVYDQATGEQVLNTRLRSTGIFNDPNDLAMIIVAGVCIALGFAADPACGALRPLLLPLVGLFGYAIYGTQSRGGLLALMAALLTLFHARWGWKRTVILAAVALPLLLVVFQGRMTSYDDAMGGGTGQARVQLWAYGIQAFRQHPFFGVGQGYYEDWAGQVAHNSFVHAFTELGFFGGALFLGAFAAALVMLYRLRDSALAESGDGAGGRSSELLAESGKVQRLLPYVTAMLVGFAVSMYSLSRNYVVPTYMMLGLMTAYGHIAGSPTQSSPLRFDSLFLKRLVVGSVCFLVVIYVFVRITVRWTGVAVGG
jgi:O-antigen ligase